MSIRNRTRWATSIASACLLSIAIGAVPASGSGTHAWLGCWELASAGRDDVPASAEVSQQLCLEADSDPSSLRLKAIVDDEVVAEEMLIADGSRRPVSEGGCEGWERSALSRDGRRIYLQSESACGDGNQTQLTGVSLITLGGNWVDINVSRVGDERELMIRRYRIADTARLSEAARAAGRRAREAAVAPLTVADVIEALEILDPAVVEAMLLETGSDFTVNADLLLELDDAGFPREIIDLMVAMSYPEHFSVDDEFIDSHAVGYSHYWAPWFHGYSYGHSPGYVSSPNVPDARPRTRAWAINERGYTRVRPSNLPSAGSGGGGAGSGGGGVGGSSAPAPSGQSQSSGGGSGYQKGNSPPTRRAVPR